METLSRENLESKTKQELINYGNLTFGANLNSRSSHGELVQAILSAAKQFSGNSEVGLNQSDTLKPGYSRIKINATELNKKGRPVIISLQGKAASLPVGKEITIPNSYVEILNNAVQFKYEPDPSNDNELVRQDIHSYPFTVIEMAPDA